MLKKWSRKSPKSVQKDSCDLETNVLYFVCALMETKSVCSVPQRGGRLLRACRADADETAPEPPARKRYAQAGRGLPHDRGL